MIYYIIKHRRKESYIANVTDTLVASSIWLSYKFSDKEDAEKRIKKLRYPEDWQILTVDFSYEVLT